MDTRVSTINNYALHTTRWVMRSTARGRFSEIPSIPIPFQMLPEMARELSGCWLSCKQVFIQKDKLRSFF